MPIKELRKDAGSVTLETAILFPVLMAVLIFGSVCIRFCVHYIKVEQCFYKTAETLSDYAYLYHEKTISEITKQWRDGIKEETDTIWEDLLADVPADIQEQLGLAAIIEQYENDLLDQAESQIYVPIAWSVFQYHAKDGDVDVLVSDASFSNSTFFQNGHEIILELQCNIALGVSFFGVERLPKCYRLRINAWVNGVGGEKTEAEEAIWEMDNFSRGKKIRSMYGANLPDTFPTIAKFENGRATMIKSLDFRKETYQETGALSDAVTSMLEILLRYQGQITPYGKEQIVILPTEIKEKELLLVIPATTQSAIVQSELAKAKVVAEVYRIVFTVQKL